MSLRIRPVRSFWDRRQFVGLPYRLYRDEPHWVAPLRRDERARLDPRRNPFFEHGTAQLFLALRDRQPVGRIAAITNGRHDTHIGDGAGFFGFFDVADDAEAASALLDAAANALRDTGYHRMRGPTNPSLHDTATVLVDGFDQRPTLMMPYHPPHTARLLREAGFREAVSLSAWHAAWRHLDRDRLHRGAEIARRRRPGLAARSASAEHWGRDAAVLRDLYPRVFADTPHFVPLSDAEFDHMAEAMRPILDPRLVTIVEDEGEPVGFALGLPDANEVLQHNRSGRLVPGALSLVLRAHFAPSRLFRTVLLGVIPEVRRSGTEAFLIHEVIERGRLAGYDASELGWVMDSNTVLVNQMAKFGAVRVKRYALFERDL